MKQKIINLGVWTFAGILVGAYMLAITFGVYKATLSVFGAFGADTFLDGVFCGTVYMLLAYIAIRLGIELLSKAVDLASARYH